MDIMETIAAARDAITVKRVYGDPYERNGVTVIAAAAVQGGGGGVEARSPKGERAAVADLGCAPGPSEPL